MTKRRKESRKAAVPRSAVALRRRVTELENENALLRVMHDEALKRASDARSDTVLKAQARGRKEGYLRGLEKVRDVAGGLRGWADLIQAPIRDFQSDLVKHIEAAEKEGRAERTKRAAKKTYPPPKAGKTRRASASGERVPPNGGQG